VGFKGNLARRRGGAEERRKTVKGEKGGCSREGAKTLREGEGMSNSKAVSRGGAEALRERRKTVKSEKGGCSREGAKTLRDGEGMRTSKAIVALGRGGTAGRLEGQGLVLISRRREESV